MGLKGLGMGLAGALVRGRWRGEPALGEIRRFVLLQYAGALGSAIHATPLVPALRAAVPDGEIIVAGSGFGVEIFRRNPGVDRVIETANPTKDLRGAAGALRKVFAGQEPAAVLTTLGVERTTVALAALLAGGRSLVGFTVAPALYRVPMRFDPAVSQIGNHLRLVEALGHPAAGAFEPQVFASADDVAYARGLVERFAEPERPLAVLVTQTSVTQRKSWRTERFAEVGRWLAGRGMNVVLVGSKAEAEAVGVVVRAIGEGALSVAGETSLGQLAALLKLCRVGVTLDTGTLHVGRAVGLPMVVIAPAWSPVVEWLPVGDARYVILKNLDMERAPEGYVIDEVSVGEVLAGVGKLLGD